MGTQVTNAHWSCHICNWCWDLGQPFCWNCRHARCLDCTIHYETNSLLLAEITLALSTNPVTTVKIERSSIPNFQSFNSELFWCYHPYLAWSQPVAQDPNLTTLLLRNIDSQSKWPEQTPEAHSASALLNDSLSLNRPKTEPYGIRLAPSTSITTFSSVKACSKIPPKGLTPVRESYTVWICCHCHGHQPYNYRLCWHCRRHTLREKCEERQRKFPWDK